MSTLWVVVRVHAVAFLVVQDSLVIFPKIGKYPMIVIAI